MSNGEIVHRSAYWCAKGFFSSLECYAGWCALSTRKMQKKVDIVRNGVVR